MRFITSLLLAFLLFPVLLVAEEAVATPEVKGAVLDSIWVFVNSPLGITVVVAIITWILGKLFTAKPKWKAYVDQYKPLLIQAVKVAEKQIPDGGGAAKLDVALKYVLKVNEKLDQKATAEALSAVHAEAERDGNLSK